MTRGQYSSVWIIQNLHGVKKMACMIPHSRKMHLGGGPRYLMHFIFMHFSPHVESIVRYHTLFVRLHEMCFAIMSGHMLKHKWTPCWHSAPDTARCRGGASSRRSRRTQGTPCSEWRPCVQLLPPGHADGPSSAFPGKVVVGQLERSFTGRSRSG